MELVNLQWDKSTYLSQIFEAEDAFGEKYIVKRNTGKLTEAQFDFLKWLMQERPTGLLVPAEIKGIVGESWEETYKFVEWPILDKILIRLFPIDCEPRHGWNFSFAKRIMKQLTSTLGILHSRGFIHHDVRAMNIFVNPRGLEATLFDYNSLRRPYFLAEGEDSWIDVPPEYTQGNCHIDFRFDVYRAGKLFFEMTHGYTRDYSRKIPRVEISDDALEVIARASHEKAEERYSDGNELHQAICSLQS